MKELANAPEEWEHRENYSLGAGLYLGKSKYYGWTISKHKIFKDSDLANYYLYAGYPEGFCVSFFQFFVTSPPLTAVGLKCFAYFH